MGGKNSWNSFYNWVGENLGIVMGRSDESLIVSRIAKSYLREIRNVVAAAAWLAISRKLSGGPCRAD
jgi:hypothetical protein